MNKRHFRDCALFTLLGFVSGMITCVALQAIEDKRYEAQLKNMEEQVEDEDAWLDEEFEDNE